MKKKDEKKDEKEKAALIKDFKETIDSEFSNYEPKLKEERKVYTNLRNNIAKKIIAHWFVNVLI